MWSRRCAHLLGVESVSSWLKSFEAAQRETLRSASRDAKSRRDAAARRVSAEADRLQMEKAHVERDAAHVAEEFERMEKMIEQQTSGDALRRAVLLEAKLKKEAELEQLRARLADARAPTSQRRGSRCAILREVFDESGRRPWCLGSRGCTIESFAGKPT